jgi:hypothetical protein
MSRSERRIAVRRTTFGSMSVSRAAPQLGGLSNFGHRANANIHKPMRLSGGRNATIVHHRLRPDRCRMRAIGKPKITISRRSMMGGMAQCQPGGTRSQKPIPVQSASISHFPHSDPARNILGVHGQVLSVHSLSSAPLAFLRQINIGPGASERQF